MSVSLVGLPPLDLVRGFVGVGRRMSMTLAAEDLCVSQSAVSKQIRALEDSLGLKLLVRGHRSVSFTPEGARLFQSADLALRQLQDSVDAIAPKGGHRPVTITASIGVAGLWLLPRLGQFQKQHPRIDVRVAARNDLVDLQAEGIELAIRYGPQAAASAGATRLFGETVAPVASPTLGLRALTSAKALEQHGLLEFDERQRPWLQWRTWFAARGWVRARTGGMLRFNQYDQLIQAAVAGQGVALGRLELLQPLLKQKHLVALDTSPTDPMSTHAYWLLQAETTARPEVTQVAQWLQAQARETQGREAK